LLLRAAAADKIKSRKCFYLADGRETGRKEGRKEGEDASYACAGNLSTYVRESIDGGEEEHYAYERDYNKTRAAEAAQ
jgi:hypothetical protein